MLGYSELSSDLSQSLSVGAHVREDDQHVFLTLVGKELGRCQGQTGRDDTLNTVCVCVCVCDDTLNTVGVCACVWGGGGV